MDRSSGTSAKRKPARLTLDFDAARDAALACIRSEGAFRMSVMHHWLEYQHAAHCAKTARKALHDLAAAVGKLVARLDAVCERAIAAMPGELLDELAKRNVAAAGMLPTVEVHRERFATFHEATLHLLNWPFQTIVLATCTVVPCDIGHPGPNLTAFAKPGDWRLWEKLWEACRSVPRVDEREFTARIIQEWAHATGAVRKIRDNAAMPAEVRALACLAEHSDWSDTKIAEAAGCNRGSLYRFPKYVAARELLEKGRQDYAHGSKSRDGAIEAWDE